MADITCIVHVNLIIAAVNYRLLAGEAAVGGLRRDDLKLPMKYGGCLLHYSKAWLCRVVAPSRRIIAS